MILEIDTSEYNEIKLSIEDGEKVISEKFEVSKSQSEKLLPLIVGLLGKNGYKLMDMTKIKVENRGASFTSLRVGVVTANALAYALKIPIISKNGTVNKVDNIEMVEADYDREPNITISTKKM